MGLIRFFKKAFSDMREDARAQHEVDKASFAAARAEAKANIEEARAMGRPENRKKKMAEDRRNQIEQATRRREQAEERARNARK